ncbi:putative glutathione s-transferase [Rosellinia necatrix]|uniref:Putative glutathione s-transferase n=1 Tax=Rosellinia necatrix TaxID=77044 RepID=A0A1S7UIV6_ROSNE|nr:putative glutathione s-transferase [Rosellinia necatrix]
MAIQSVVLDPDGDILVIVPGTLPDGLPKGLNYPALPVTTSPPPPPEFEFNGTESENAETAWEGATNGEEQLPSAPETEREDQWQFKASSKHLSLASTYVKKMMLGPWREANEIHDDGSLHWSLEGFDVTAIYLILCVIHGLNRRVPCIVGLSMLAQIARAVDYLDCHEAMELYASIWMIHLGTVASESTKADWDNWISITGVFQNDDAFSKWTRVAIVKKENCSPSPELPVLSRAYDIIDQWRQAHLDKILDHIYNHVVRLSAQKTCSGECDSMLLGTLLRQMHTGSLTCIRPVRPYEGLSIGRVVKMVKGLSIPEWYSKPHGADELAPNPSKFRGAPQKATRLHPKKAELRAKKKAVSTDGWGVANPDEVDDFGDVVVIEHECGFGDLIAAVTALESGIKGLNLEKDLGI